MDYCRVSVSNISTVDSLLQPPLPPAMMREQPLHTAAVLYHSVGIAGRLGSHFMSLPSPMRLRRESVAPPDICPPTIGASCFIIASHGPSVLVSFVPSHGNQLPTEGGTG